MLISVTDSIYSDRGSLVCLILGQILKSRFTSVSFDLSACMIAATLGILIFHVQHTFEEASRVAD